MAGISRREFVKTTAVGTAAAGLLASGVKLQANPLGLPIGSQTYPHRAEILKGNFAGVLKELKQIGVDQIELCGPIGTGYPDFAPLKDGAAARKMILDAGLRPISAHFMMADMRSNLAAAIAWSKALGLEQMMVPTMGAPVPQGSPAPPYTMDDVKRLCDEFNKIAAEINRNGMRAGIHNEGFELSTINGRRTYDLCLEATDPKLVGFQFQMSTIINGLVAADYFQKYPGRFFSMHVQDVGKPAQPGGRGTQMSVGQGIIDWNKTWAAARQGGVRNYFVEQNMELTRGSVTALKAMK
jgi:sugar phosphate isomerase/epimerase